MRMRSPLLSRATEEPSYEVVMQLERNTLGRPSRPTTISTVTQKLQFHKMRSIEMNAYLRF